MRSPIEYFMYSSRDDAENYISSGIHDSRIWQTREYAEMRFGCRKPI